MRFFLCAVVLAASIGLVRGDDCAEGSVDDAGNWYCQPVQAIHYANVGTPGSYQKITAMSGGSCSSEAHSFSGPISPLDEEVRFTLYVLFTENLANFKHQVSVHIRGPFALKQFAAYSMAHNETTSAAIPKASSGAEVNEKHRRGHGHLQFHESQEKRATPATVRETVVETVIETIIETVLGNATSIANGTYVRTGYYNAVNGTADNLTFIGNYGGQGSGVWDE